jgi:hypothetical protein
MTIFSLLGVGDVEEIALEEFDALSESIDTFPCIVAMNAANWSDEHGRMSGLHGMDVMITCCKRNGPSWGDWIGHAGGDGAMDNCGGV